MNPTISKLAIPKFGVTSNFTDPEDLSDDPDEWYVVLDDTFPAGPLSLCCWRSKGMDSLIVVAQIEESEWPEFVDRIMDATGGPKPRDLANELLARLYGEYRGFPPEGSTKVFREALVEWILQNRAVAGT